MLRIYVASRFAQSHGQRWQRFEDAEETSVFGAWDDVQNSGFRRPGTEVIQASAESVPFAGFAPVSGERTASRRNVFMGSPGTSHDLFDRYHVDRTARPLKRAVFQPEPIFRLDLADDNEDLPCMQQAHSKAGCYRVYKVCGSTVVKGPPERVN